MDTDRQQDEDDDLRCHISALADLSIQTDAGARILAAETLIYPFALPNLNMRSRQERLRLDRGEPHTYNRQP